MTLDRPAFTYPLFNSHRDKLWHGTFTHTLESHAIAFGKQVHGKQIAIINRKPEETIECDAIMTQTAGLHIGIKHADCQAAILFDPITNSLAVVHAGWRGLVENIYGATIEEMKRTFAVNPKDLLIAVSPSLGPAHSEFIHYKQEFPPSFWAYQEKPFYFNLRKIAESQFIESGVKRDNLFIEPTDTYEELHLCHSYRRNKTEKRMVTAACLLTKLNR